MSRREVALPLLRLRTAVDPQFVSGRSAVPAAVPASNRALTIALLVAISYYAGSQIGFFLTPADTPIATFWPPNAILLPALMVCRKRRRGTAKRCLYPNFQERRATVRKRPRGDCFPGVRCFSANPCNIVFGCCRCDSDRTWSELLDAVDDSAHIQHRLRSHHRADHRDLCGQGALLVPKSKHFGILRGSTLNDSHTGCQLPRIRQGTRYKRILGFHLHPSATIDLGAPAFWICRSECIDAGCRIDFGLEYHARTRTVRIAVYGFRRFIASLPVDRACNVFPFVRRAHC